MKQIFAVALFVVLALSATVPAKAVSASVPTSVQIADMLTRAIGLLDRQPQPNTRIGIVDPSKVRVESPEMRRRLLKEVNDLGGLTILGQGPVAYMNVRGKYFNLALEGDSFALYVVASIIAHELEHAENQSGECRAYSRQEDLLRSYLDKRLIQGKRADDYLFQIKTMRVESCAIAS